MVSIVSPALVKLLDKDGMAVFPRLMWKRGDDLRRDLIAMVFFEGRRVRRRLYGRADCLTSSV